MSYCVVLKPTPGQKWDRPLFLLTNGAFSCRTHKKLGVWRDFRSAQRAMAVVIARGAPSWKLEARPYDRACDSDRAAHRPDPEPSMAGAKRDLRWDREPEEPCPPTARSSGCTRPRRLTAREQEAAASLMGALLAPLFKHHGG
jgi:hypothetical protein